MKWNFLILMCAAALGCSQDSGDSAGAQAAASPFPVPAVISIAPAGPSNVNAVTITGTSAPSANIELFKNTACSGPPDASTVADGAGNWSIPTTVPDDSATRFRAKADDGTDESFCSSTSVIYYEDSTPPAMPTFTSLTPSAVSTDNSPTLRGRGTIGSTVEVFSDASCTALIGTVIVNTGSNYIVDLTVADDSTTPIYAMAHDAYGNYTACSGLLATYIEDSTPPNMPVITGSVPAGPSNSNVPVVSGTADSSIPIRFYSDAACTTQIGSTTSNAGGNFSRAITVPSNTTTTIYANAYDLAGNFSTCSATFVSYVEDSAPPAAPVVTATTPALKGLATAITVDGTAEMLSTVNIYSNAACTTLVATGSADGAGNFSLAVTAPANTNVVYRAKATDGIGNVSACSATSAAYEAFTIAAGAAYFTGTQTTAAGAPTNLNQATAESLKWSSSYFDATYFQHSLTADTHEIEVLTPGNYFLSLTLPVAGAVAGGSIRAEVRVNGTVVPGAHSQSAYLSNTLGHSEASGHLAIILPGLMANDTVDVTVTQNGAAGAIAISGSARLQMDYLNPGSSLFVATGTQTANGTDLNDSVAYAMQWNNTIADTGFTHSSGTEDITLDDAGEYLVYVNIPLEGTVTNGAVKAMVKLNGTTITGGTARQGYISNTGGHTLSSLHWAGLVRAVSPNQILTVATQMDAQTGTIEVPATQAASISIEKLNSQSGLFAAGGNQLASGTDLNVSPKSSMLWPVAPIKDGAVYNHSTVMSSQSVRVLSAGDYQVFLNTDITGAVTSANLNVRVEVNGAPLSGAQTKSHFISNAGGHTKSSGSLVLGLHRLRANDVVTLTCEREANAGVLNSASNIITFRKKP